MVRRRGDDVAMLRPAQAGLPSRNFFYLYEGVRSSDLLRPAQQKFLLRPAQRPAQQEFLLPI